MFDVVDRNLRRSRATLRNVHPATDRILETSIRYYARLWIDMARLRNSIRYEAPIDPMRRFRVDPTAVGQTVTWTQISADRKSDEHPWFRAPKYRLAGRVFAGNWDQETARVIDSTIHTSFIQHFEEDVPWDETAFFAETLQAIQDGATPWECSSRSDLYDRCTYLDHLYDSIATEGYRSQDELHEAGAPTSDHRLYRVVWEEIGVNVGRNGEFILQDGRNRLAIAQILGLDHVPVVILVRHRQWQRLRDQIVRGELPPAELPRELRTHPDLVDLFSPGERRTAERSVHPPVQRS